jgi:hypothetical protein
MSTGLRAAVARLPAWAREIGQLLATDESFRSICDDLAAAEVVLSGIDDLPETIREERRSEYQSLIDSLVREIEDALRSKKVVPFTGKPPPKDEEYQGQQELERSLMLKQIGRIVADAKANNNIVNANQHAARLFAAFPHANLPITRIVEEIVHAAEQAQVALEFGG